MFLRPVLATFSFCAAVAGTADVTRPDPRRPIPVIALDAEVAAFENAIEPISGQLPYFYFATSQQVVLIVAPPLERHVPLPHNPLPQAHRHHLAVMRYGDDFAELRIADAKLDNDRLSFLKERPHRRALVALHVPDLSVNLARIDLGLTNGLDPNQEKRTTPHRAERSISCTHIQRTSAILTQLRVEY